MKEDLVAPAREGFIPAQEKGWDEALEERLDHLQNSVGDTRRRLQGQRSRLEQLRSDLTVLRGELQTSSQKADALAQALPRSSPPPMSSPAPLPWAELRPEPAAEPASFWPKALTYGLLLSLGLGLGFGSQRLAAAARELMAPPAPAAAAPKQVPQKPLLAGTFAAGERQQESLPAAPASEEASLAEEEANGEALRLIYDYKPAGSSLSVRELLGPEIVASSESEASPWVVTRDEDGTALVTFRPYGEIIENAPVYEFEVDLEAKTVRASDETALSLKLGTAAAR